ncbi:hypothetical protein [Nocardioides lianchengensis]|uniref:SurA N-terminal domain-containing protein n=1 Tax=Nocardioides lianchengensis TaxID=1045774 RepID=A0A1G6VQT1_9ACTN|nr:hypothetical protein [Nocardioides lianchengensis]NYG11263.1 hypothetical protein [Nocardioides lianchengensis]SDD55891.1 hypothetical protein SAMN05421872_10919 [Nocardioides lianchengensis]
MSPRRPLAVVLAAVVPVCAGLLTGCGVTDAGIRPGQAVSINGTTISVTRVDDVASSACAVLRSDPQFDGQAIAGTTLRNAAQRGLSLEVMADQLVDAFDVQVPDTDETAQAYRETYASADPDDVAAAEPVFVADQYFSNVLLAIGAEEAGADAAQDAVVAAGVAAVQDWQADADIDTNPAFDAISVGDDQILTTRDDLSVATTDFAVDASAAEAPEGFAKDLPESQRCGG